jgi:arylsulfatase A-like enzyme
MIKRTALMLLMASTMATSTFAQQTKAKPNIVYILADDLGYGELGSYGQQKIETPNG